MTRLSFIGASSALALSTAVDLQRKVDAVVMDEQPEAAPAESMQWPDASTNWRVNNAALAPIAAKSPLETRQQRRAASKALARSLATAGKMKEREERVLQRKRDRADAAHARHTRIANHVPSVPE